MKKSLIALAVLAASGAAMAQSSVTLYGIADVWIGSVDDGTTTTTKMVSGGTSTSRWGMKGTEDLGGGLKAEFQLESAVGMDTGASAGFSRHAWVGLAGGFGAVRVGKTSTPYDDFAGGSNAVFDADFAPWYLGNMPAEVAYEGKTNNTIKYVSPAMGGFVGAVSYSLDEDVAVNAAVTSMGLNYAGGPLGAQLVYQKEDKSTTGDDTAFLKAGVSYNFGMATAKAFYASTTDLGNVAGADVTEYQLGADFPVSAAMTLSANYVSADYNAAAGDKETTGYSFAVAYSLSKRTTVYGGYGSITTDFAGPAADADVSAFAVGIKHTF